MQQEDIFALLMFLVPIGIIWNIYLEYAKNKNEIKQLREEIEKIKQIKKDSSSDDG